MSCKECKESRSQKLPETVSFAVYEAAMTRKERMLKRLWQTIIFLLVLLVATNSAWLWYESQFETLSYTQEVTQEADGGNNTFIGGDSYGETNDKNNH